MSTANPYIWVRWWDGGRGGSYSGYILLMTLVLQWWELLHNVVSLSQIRPVESTEWLEVSWVILAQLEGVSAALRWSQLQASKWKFYLWYLFYLHTCTGVLWGKVKMARSSAPPKVWTYKSHGNSVQNTSSGSVCVGWSLRFCITGRCLSDASAAGSRTTLWAAWL